MKTPAVHFCYSLLLILTFASPAFAADKCEDVLVSGRPATVAATTTAANNVAAPNTAQTTERVIELRGYRQHLLDRIEAIRSGSGRARDRAKRIEMLQEELRDNENDLRIEELLREVRSKEGQEPAQVIRERYRQIRIEQANYKLSQFRKVLDKVSADINKELVGLERYVEQIASSFYTIMQKQANLIRSSNPPVIPLMGYPGVGKSEIVNLFVRKLNLESVFIREVISDNADYIPVDKWHAKGRPIRERNPSELDIGEIEIKIDYVFMIDEVQKLRPYKDREAFRERMENPEVVRNDQVVDYDKKVRDLEIVREAKESNMFIWTVQGEGRARQQLKNPKDHIGLIRNQGSNLRIKTDLALRALTALKKKEQERSEGTATDADVAQVKQQYETAEAERSAIQFAMEDAISDMKKKSMASLGRYADLSTPEIFKVVSQDTTSFVNYVKEQYEINSTRSVELEYGNGLVFIVANPEKLIEQRFTSASDANGRVDTALLSRLDNQDSRPAMQEFFVNLFGPNAGWLRRLNFEAWNMMPHLSEPVWRRLTRNKIEEQINSLRAQLVMEMNNRINVNIDESVIDFLRLTLEDVRGGAGVTAKNLENVLSQLSRRLPDMLTAHKRERNSWSRRRQAVNLTLKADTARRSLIVEETGENNSGFRGEIQLNVPRSSTKMDRQADGLAASQLAVYQAARIVSASVLLRSLPRGVIENTPSALETVDALWANPSLTNLRYLNAKLTILASGFVAERMLLERTGIVNTQYAHLDMEVINTIAKQIKSELENLRQIQAARMAPGAQVNIEHLVHSSLSNDRVLRAIYEDRNELIFQSLDRQVRNILDYHPYLIQAIAARLIEKKFITPEEVSTLFTQYANRRPNFIVGLFKRVFTPLIHFFRSSPDSSAQVEVDLQQLMTADPGSVNNPLSQLAEPPPPPRQGFVSRMLQRIRTVSSGEYLF